MNEPSTAKRYHQIIRVFVSSTFSDLVHERNALNDRVWPELERYCLLRGFQLQAIDLRWGVSTEAGLDHRAMAICLDELRRAQEVSPQPNFLILLGDRYGWQPLPEEIAPDDFAALEAAANADGNAIATLNAWYRLDTNPRPAVHRLRSRRESPDGRDYTHNDAHRDTDAWIEVQNVLWSLINSAFPPERLAGRFAELIPQGRKMPPIVRFQGSATEQEIWHGALTVANARGHIVAFSREIAPADLAAAAGHPGLRDFVNVDASGECDVLLHDAAKALTARLKDLLGDNLLSAPRPATLRPAAGDPPALEISTDHLDALCDHVHGHLLAIIERQIEEYNRVPPAAAAASLSGETLRDLQREREHHARFAAERAPVGVFVGRCAEMDKIRAYLNEKEPTARESRPAITGESTDPQFIRPFVLHGISGSGKSALMAVAAREAAARPGALMIERYLGTSHRSSDLRSLLIDLCQSLREIFPLGAELPTDIRLLEKEFYEQLANATAEHPVYVFLDALDQLDPADDAPRLWWIRSTPLPPHARLVLSCLSDPEDETAAGPWNTLREHGFLQSDSAAGIDTLEPAEAQQLWTRWLEKANRGLSAPQQAAVEERIVHGPPACRQPLYLRILFEEARHWPAYAPPPPIGESVPALLDALFDRLGEAAAHGPLLEPALGYLVSARYGLTENELLELLYRDPDYKPHLLASAHHALPRGAKRVPIALWSRLRYDLAPYLAERGAPGGSVLQFYHRQVGARVRERFAGAPEKRYHWHRRSALYFARQPWWLEPPARRRERMKPPYSASPAHVRKITELPEHLVALAREAGEARRDTGQALTWIERLFQKLSFLEAKVAAGLTFELPGDFARAVAALPAERPQRRILSLLDEAIRRDIHFIARHSGDYPQALFQCAWNHGWWYDCPDAARHYDPPEGGWTRPAPWDRSGPKLHMLIERWRSRRAQSAPGFAWLRSHRPPAVQLGSPLKAILRGHEMAVCSVAYSQDSACIASGSSDKTVRVWSSESGVELAILQGHRDEVVSVSYSVNGRWIISGSSDMVCVWDAACRYRHRTFWIQRALWEARFGFSISNSPDGRRIGIGYNTHSIRVLDMEKEAILAILKGHGDCVNSVSLSPDGRCIISGSDDGTIRIWDIESGTERNVLQGNKEPVQCVAFSQDGRWIASGSGTTPRNNWVWGLPLWNPHNAVRLWDAQSGAEVAVLRGHEKMVSCVAFSPDGRRIVSGSADKTVRIWDTASCKCLVVLHGHKREVTSVAFSPDRTCIVSGSLDGTVRLWDAVSGECLPALRGHEDWGNNVAFSPDGALAVSGSDDNTVQIWDVASGEQLAVLHGHENLVKSVAFSPDGARIVSGSRDKTLRLWDVASGKCQKVLHGHDREVTIVAFSPDGARIISGSQDSDLRLWDSTTGKCLDVLCGHYRDISSVAFSLDSAYIASGGDDIIEVIRLWDATTGKCLDVLRKYEGDVHGVAFSPDGTRIFFGADDNTMRLWDTRSGECLHVIQGSGDVAAIAAGPDTFPFRALRRGTETEIEDSRTGNIVARFPAPLEHIITHPRGRVWAGKYINHLYLIALEGPAS